MAKEEDKIRAEGVVVEALPGTQFRVRLDNGHEVLAYLSGKMRKRWVRLTVGDRVIGVGFDYARLRTRPLVALGAMLATAALLLGAASVWLARRIAQPVQALEEAAAQLGLYRPTLYSKMRKHKIRDERRVRRGAARPAPVSPAPARAESQVDEEVGRA